VSKEARKRIPKEVMDKIRWAKIQKLNFRCMRLLLRSELS
jgi:hypothetical protein